MSAATPDSAAAKRQIESTLDDPSPPAKLQRSSQPDPSPAAGATNGGGEVAGARSEEMAGGRNPRGQRYLVAVEYIGAKFSGSQQQPNQRTVVGVLEMVIAIKMLFMLARILGFILALGDLICLKIDDW
uniref:Uncharacterized protein n=1 Tax=Leersia perrieri TaxID=77586 RepID=A0A0D9XXN9_9ORYZ